MTPGKKPKLVDQWDEQAERLGKVCYRNAKKECGDMWQHFSREMQWAFVSKHVLAMCVAQDDTISDTRVRKLMTELTEYCRWVTFS